MLQVRPGRDRPVTRGDGTRTWHSFSFGRHYDPAQVGLGPLVAVNEEHLEPGAGYPEHLHTGVDLVTWLVQGELRHEDSTGSTAVLRPGSVQVLRAGSGVRHAEHAGATGPVRFLQLWLVTDDVGVACARADVSDVLARGGVVVLAAGGRGVGLALGDPGATVSVVRVPPGQVVDLPGADLVLVHVVDGAVAVVEGLPGHPGAAGTSAHELRAGDEARGGPVAGLRLLGRVASEVLVSTYDGPRPLVRPG